MVAAYDRVQLAALLAAGFAWGLYFLADFFLSPLVKKTMIYFYLWGFSLICFIRFVLVGHALVHGPFLWVGALRDLTSKMARRTTGRAPVDEAEDAGYRRGRRD